ncbi:tetratricopeptide repeat protein [uncultured Dokdonia sp.]|uniref:tetratricopeptide repeat protein n=1 Tax=uncultured Dokdonia sp. TaxID=575653 RepID=UPI0026017D0F|nr:tetratricopeptide repeat protein [uncultured Dokdonia sp.]
MPKTTLLLLVLWIQSCFVFGQNSKIDSLKNVAAQETNVTEKLKNYFLISNEYYRKQLRYDSAFVYLKKIRTIAHEEGNKEAELVALNNQALIYEILGDKEKAISYFNKGLHVSKELSMPSRDVLLYNNIGLLYKDLKQYEKSLTYLDSAYVIVKNGESRRLFGVVNTSLGETNYATGNYKESIHYLKIGVSILDSLQQPSSEADFALAKSYRAEKKIDSAILQAEKAFREAQEQNAPKSAYESSLLLSSMYAEIGDSEKEAIYLKETLRYNDSLSIRTNLNDIELKELKEQQKVQAQQLQSLKNKDLLYTILYIIGAIVLILLGILLFKQFKTSKLTKDMHEAHKTLIKSELDKRKNNTKTN